MRRSLWLRVIASTMIVFLLFILTWFVSPKLVYSQDEYPEFSADECPETIGEYQEHENGHLAVPGFLNCRYHKSGADNPEHENWKSLYITYHHSPDEALAELEENYLNDDHLKKFLCETYDDCDKIDRVLMEQTDQSFTGYTITLSKDPESYPDNYSLENRFVYGNYSVTIFVQGELFSNIEEAKSELTDLEVAAKGLADEPREMVARATAAASTTEATEPPSEEMAGAEDEDLTETDLAAMIMLFGLDPERLSEWEGWENLSANQQENLIKVIDRLDVILENKRQEEIVKQAAEIVAEEIDTYHHVYNYFAISSVAIEYGDRAALDAYESVYVDDYWGLGSIYLDHAYYEPTSASAIAEIIVAEEEVTDPKEIAKETIKNFSDDLKYVTPEVMLWQSYCNLYVDPEATLEEQHATSMEELRKDYQFFVDKGIYFDFSPGGKVDMALYNLERSKVACPKELP